jgi:hypothetical protein
MTLSEAEVPPFLIPDFAEAMPSRISLVLQDLLCNSSLLNISFLAPISNSP